VGLILVILITALAVSQVVLGGLMSSNKTWHRVFFASTGLLLLVLTIAQAVINNRDQNALQEQIQALAKATIETSQGVKELLGKPTVPHPNHTRYAQRNVRSSNANAPYELQVIIETDVPIQNAGFRIECDGPIIDGQFFVTGQPIMMNVRTTKEDKAFVFSFGYPTFTPQSPIVVTLLSKTQIKVTKIEKAQD
jgi:hypothetical protein